MKDWILKGLRLGIAPEQVATDLCVRLDEVRKVGREAGLIKGSLKEMVLEILNDPTRIRETYTQMARKFGVTASAIAQIARRAGIFRGRGHRASRFTERNSRIISFVKQGRTQGSVARQFKVERSYVSRLVSRSY